MPNNQNTTAVLQPVRRASSSDAGLAERAADFRANPHLSMARLGRVMSHNAGVEATIRPDLATALDEAAPDHAAVAAAPARPRKLAGSVVIRRNRTSTAHTSTLYFAPSAADMAALLAGEHLAHDLLASGMPTTLAAQADAIAHYADPIYKAYDLRRLERRGVQVAEAAARHYLNHGQPAGLVFARTGHLARWYAEQCDLYDDGQELSGESHDDSDEVAARHGMRDASAARLVRRARLAWAHPDGIEHGLLLDRFHHAHQRGAIERDSWIRRKVAEDLASLDMFLMAAYRNGTASTPGANLGVRVHAHRAPNTGIHFLPDYAGGGGRPVPGDFHRLGACEHCATQATLPNTSPVATVAEVLS